MNEIMPFREAPRRKKDSFSLSIRHAIWFIWEHRRVWKVGGLSFVELGEIYDKQSFDTLSLFTQSSASYLFFSESFDTKRKSRKKVIQSINSRCADWNLAIFLSSRIESDYFIRRNFFEVQHQQKYMRKVREKRRCCKLMSIAGRMRKRIMCIKMFENFAVSGEEIRFSGLISECVHSLKKK